MQAMRLEHCVRDGHDIPFTPPNYQITTTPENEWCIVVDGKQPAQEHMGHGRTILCIASACHWVDPDDLVLREMDDPAGAASEERMRAARALITKAGLQRGEVVAVILYTGPMVRPQHLSPIHFSSFFAFSHTVPPLAMARSTT